jgi:glycosyltransferase involved in cell wall biosynthesis
MILIDALYINTGGGKVLLKYLIDNLPKTNQNIFFLLDNRLENEYKDLKINSIFIKNSLFKRHLFYIKYKSKLNTVFAFANLPPTIKLNCNVITFFQNVLLVDNSFTSIKFELKKLIFYFLVPNSNLWIVQTAYVKNLLQRKIGRRNNILILPFFETYPPPNIISKRNISVSDDLRFIYPSSGESHKNHENLFKAFAIVNKIHPKYTLTVTVGKEYTKLISIISDFNYQNVKIVNVGNISKDDLILEYTKADICLYPSLNESFGLGLIEAAQFGLPIFASDLPYVKEVVKPSCFFDPLDEKSIATTMLNYHDNILNNVKIIVDNQFFIICNLIGANKNIRKHV